MKDDDTRIIPPDDGTVFEPPPSPLHPGSAESGAASGRPGASEEPVVAEAPVQRRKPTPGATTPPDSTPGTSSVEDFNPPPIQPLRPGGAAVAGGAAGAAAGAAVGASAQPPVSPAPPIPPVPPAGNIPPTGAPATPPAGTPVTPQSSNPATPPAGAPATPPATPQASNPAAPPADAPKTSETPSLASQSASEETSVASQSETSSEIKSAPENKSDIPSSQRQPAYNRSPYEKASSGGGDKTKQLLWALVGSAFVISILALLLALGVLQVNSSQVRSSDIADGAVGSRQIAPGSVRESNLAAELQRDIFGKEGPPGPQGESGPRGARGPAGISEIRAVEREVSGTSVDAEVSAVALCDESEVVLSGGAMISGSEGTVALTVSEPSAELSGWRGAAVQSEPAEGAWSLRVYALCAKPTQQLRNNSLP